MPQCSQNTLFVPRPTTSNNQNCNVGPNGMTNQNNCTNVPILSDVSKAGKIGPRPNREKIRKNLIDYVLLRLGAPTVKIELDQQTLDLLVDETLDIYQEYAPREFYSYYVFQTLPGKSVYKMPPDIGLIRNVFYKQTPNFTFQSSDLGGSIPLEYFGGAYVNSSLQGGLIDPTQPLWGQSGSWVLYKEYEMMYSKISSAIGGWEWVNDLSEIKLYPTPCGGACNSVIVQYLQADKDWTKASFPMREGILALATITLGTIRKKFSSFPNAMNLDGESLYTKGWELYDKWLENLLSRHGDIPYIQLW